jgi:pyridoxal phosphate enzyme (YggS family)
VTQTSPEPARAEELRLRLAAVRERIGRACEQVGRDPSGVTLVVVTKTYPASDVRLLAELGVRDVAENRDQEASAKAEACAELGLRWHFVGQLQSNKARSVARYASWVHSVDRPALVTALGRAAGARQEPLDCLVQLSLDGDTSRGGAPLDELDTVAGAIVREPGLRLRGIMAVAPLGVDPVRAFAVLPGLLEGLRRRYGAADVLSAGMSGDLEAAILSGATHLRVGTAVLGRRVITR